MFKLLGVVLSAYVLYSIFAGRVVARSGPGARVVVRSDTPGYYWTVIGIYSALCLGGGSFMITYFIALLLLAVCVPARAAIQAAISGPTQLEVILKDRPQIAAILMDRQDIREWLIEELGSGNPQPLWDPTEPLTGRAAEHEYPSRGGAAPAGTALIRVNSQRSGWDQLAGLVFELHNLRRSARFEEIHRAAVSGAIDKPEYIRRSLRQEFAALHATKRFFEQHIDGIPENARKSSPLFEQIMETEDTLEAHLEEQSGKGLDLTVHFDRLYEQEVAPRRRGTDAADR